ncbi:hypothetical protein ACET3Z_031486 [Daucus carota]
MEKPPRIPRKTATMWLVQQPYPNNNGGRTVIRLTEHLRIVIAQIDRLLEEEQKAIGNQEAGNSEEDDDEEASEVEHVQENEFVPEQEAYVEEPVENEPPEQEVFIPTEAETQVKESEVKPYIPGGEYRPSVSTGQINLDASADSGLDIGVSQQPTDNEPDITGEPTEKFNA